MVKHIVTYSDWNKLSEKEKYYLVDNIWLNDMKEGKNIRRFIINDFKKKFNYRNYFVNIEFRWYGLYNLGIFVTIKKGCKVRLPRKFDIFFVEKEYI